MRSRSSGNLPGERDVFPAQPPGLCQVAQQEWCMGTHVPLASASRRVWTVSFRDDLGAASDWVASYVETMGERPVAANVAPGDIRAKLPASPPEKAEPFADVLRDFDELIVPGLTLWNH